MREQFIQQERHADRSLQFLLLPSSGLFYLKVANMLKTETTESIMSILLGCSVKCEQSGRRLSFINSPSSTGTDAAITVASRYYNVTYFESRKRRPQERGRKKRRKGKWNPIDRLWNSTFYRNCGSNHLLGQD
jgi:hypothetical protein